MADINIMEGMEKLDTRKLPREAQDKMRRQAMRRLEELRLLWKAIAKFVGVHVSTISVGPSAFHWKAQPVEIEDARSSISVRPNADYGPRMAVAFNHRGLLDGQTIAMANIER
jgi:hypothetical protein